jgi:hypothetical protein
MHGHALPRDPPMIRMREHTLEKEVRPCDIYVRVSNFSMFPTSQQPSVASARWARGGVRPGADG